MSKITSPARRPRQQLEAAPGSPSMRCQSSAPEVRRCELQRRLVAQRLERVRRDVGDRRPGARLRERRERRHAGVAQPLDLLAPAPATSTRLSSARQRSSHTPRNSQSPQCSTGYGSVAAAQRRPTRTASARAGSTRRNRRSEARAARRRRGTRACAPARAPWMAAMPSL